MADQSRALVFATVRPVLAADQLSTESSRLRAVGRAQFRSTTRALVQVYDPVVHNVVVKHWWNNAWGRLSRRDVYVRTDGRSFQLELRHGGSEGRSWRREYPQRGQAEEEARRHMDPAMTWIDLTAAHPAPG